jgi:hypothetical protein
MEDRARHRIGISQNQPDTNADVAPQKYNGTKGLLQENARRRYGRRFTGLELPRVSPYSKYKSAYSCFVNFITF